MKKTLALILAAVMLTTLTACSDDKSGSDIVISDTDNGSNSESSSSEESKSESSSSEESKSESSSSEESKSESSSSEESKSESSSSEESKSESSSSEESKPEDSGSTESKPEDSGSTESKPEDSGSTESKPEDSGSTESKPGDSGSTESKPGDSKPIGAKLPLAEYPDGSYFTVDGKACADHNNCSLTGGCNCKSFDGGIQAFGFARYVYYTVKGEHLGAKTAVDKDVTAEEAKALLSSLPEGTYIGVRTKEDSPHALILISADDNGITFYQANYGGLCLVTAPTYSWELFASRFPHINDYAV